jgi:DNA repair protein RecO (recombination protein O)
VAVLTTPAILLRAVDYGESDRVTTLLGRTTGCVSAIARGARKSQRRFGGGLGLCNLGDAVLRERGGAELLTLCAPRQAEPGIFDFMVTFLEGLDAGGGRDERLRIFEIGLLDRLGFAPALDACAVCGRRDLSTTAEVIDVRWVPDQGGVVCRACGTRGRPMRPVVRLALLKHAGTALDAPAVDAVPADVGRGCRDALHELIAGHLSAPLRSLEFLAKMQVTEKES